ESKNHLKLLPLFLFPQILSIPIFILYYSSSKENSYLFSVWAFQTNSFPWKEQARLCWDYLGGLFWGVETARWGYKPVWGGYLNSVETALFLTGLLELKREIHLPLSRWVLVSFFIFLIPGLLSNEFEMLRLLLVLPLLLWFCAAGTQRLLLDLSSSRRVLVGVVLMVSAGTLGVYHLVGP